MSAKTVFMFSGQGSQYYQMGKQLFDENRVFRDWMLRLDAIAHERTGRRVVDAIYSSGKAATFDDTRLTHPAIFIVEYALAQCLMHEGIEPDVTLGASLGSFAAAAVSGFMDVEDALAAVLEQACAFDLSCARGGMIAVLADPSVHEEDFLRVRSEMAGINFDNHFVVSAPLADLDIIERNLRERGIAHERLPVSFAYHSRWIDSAQEPFQAFMRSIRLRDRGLPLVCCEQGKTLARLPEDFFWRVVRGPLRFRDALRQLEAQGPHRYIDVGPSGTLATFVKHAMRGTPAPTAHAVLTPYGRDQKNLAALLSAQ
jgi:acyl transferase domain-containing protein